MKELVRIKDYYVDEIYQGITNDGIEIICILDDYCVRYMKFKKAKHGGYDKCIYRSEFSNDEKEKCFKLATKALNK